MSAGRLLKGGLILTVGNTAGALASLLRNIIIARCISIEDFGIAMMLALTISFVEMASNMAIDRILVQAPDGDSQRMQSTGQAFQALRGLIGAFTLFLLAEPVARLFGVEHVAWAFQMLAVVPAIRGFLHYDPFRYQRKLKFTAATLMEVLPQFVTLALALPLAKWLGDYRVILWLIIAQTILQVLLSHRFAVRSYQWTWDRAVLKRMIRFGWPLMVNGFLMFVIFQGDKVIVGAAFSMEELGWYSATFMLALAPTMIIIKVLQSLLLPVLAKVQNDAAAFHYRYTLTLQVCLLFAVVFGTVMILAGAAMLELLYGERYVEGAYVISILGLMQAARIAKAGPMLAAIARGSTENAMYSNLIRVAGLIVAAVLVSKGAGIFEMAIVGAGSELLSFFLSLVLLKVKLRLSISHILPAMFLVGSVLSVFSVVEVQAFNDLSSAGRLGLGALIATITMFLCLPLMREVLSILLGFYRYRGGAEY